MLIPGGVLMTLIIVIPFLIGVWISLTDLDQYTLRRWLSAPFVGLANYVESFSAGLPASIWISISFAIISTAVTVPIGVAAAIVTQNRYRVAHWSARSSSSRTCCVLLRRRDGLADDAQPDGIINNLLNKVGIGDRSG
jgi:multiple sugar transport system permease protein